MVYWIKRKELVWRTSTSGIQEVGTLKIRHFLWDPPPGGRYYAGDSLWSAGWRLGSHAQLHRRRAEALALEGDWTWGNAALGRGWDGFGLVHLEKNGLAYGCTMKCHIVYLYTYFFWVVFSWSFHNAVSCALGGPSFFTESQQDSRNEETLHCNYVALLCLGFNTTQHLQPQVREHHPKSASRC